VLAGRVDEDRLIGRANDPYKVALGSLNAAGSARPLRDMPLRHANP
jgi:hypothetical protein